MAHILHQFANAEAGNRITQFNMGGLANILMGVIDGVIKVQDARQQFATPQEFPTAQVDMDE